MNTDYSARTDVDWNEIKKQSLKYCTGNYDDDRPLTEKDVVEEMVIRNMENDLIYGMR